MEQLHDLFSILPLRSPTLPPATETNCYLVGGSKFLLVEPAAVDEDEQRRLIDKLDSLEAEGRTPLAVVLTHHHGDHIGSARLVSDTFHVPVWSHPLTAERLEGRVEIDRHLVEGDWTELEGVGRVEFLFTPGHAPGHIVLNFPTHNAMIVGDMVAGIGTILIDPSDGDMTEYLTQLERLARHEPSLLYAAHGPPIASGGARLREYVAHRTKRELKVLQAVKVVGSGRPADFLPIAYDDTPAALFPLAERSCHSHLIKLAREGRVSARGDVYSDL